MLSITSKVFEDAEDVQIPICRGFTLYSLDSEDLTITLGGGDSFTLKANVAFETNVLPEQISPIITVAGTGSVIVVYYS